jgi:hypothetical protein
MAFAPAIDHVAPPASPRRAGAKAAPGPNPDFGHALDELEAGHWPQAFAELGALADTGHAPAARIALMLAARGGLLFGGHFRATPQALANWRAVAQG